MAASGPCAIIIGGSVGGLFIGNMLARMGWQVEIHERVAEGLVTRGTGIARHPELDMILAAAGAEEAGIVGVDVPGRCAIGPDGSVTAQFAYPQTLGPWARVLDPLRRAFTTGQYHAGSTLRSLRPQGSGIEAAFEDGSARMADLLIGADGFRSTVRRLCSPDVTPRYAGYVAWRGIAEERDLSPQWRDLTIGQYAFASPHGGQFIGYARCLPVFEAFSRAPHHLGAFGNGTRMKLVVNLLVAIHTAAAGEAFAMTRVAGLDPAQMFEVVADGAGGSSSMKVRGPMLITEEYLPIRTMPLALWRKDMRVIAEFADSLQCPTPMFSAAVPLFNAAIASGYGEHDTAAVAAVFRQMVEGQGGG